MKGYLHRPLHGRGKENQQRMVRYSEASSRELEYSPREMDRGVISYSLPAIAWKRDHYVQELWTTEECGHCQSPSMWAEGGSEGGGESLAWNKGVKYTDPPNFQSLILFCPLAKPIWNLGGKRVGRWGEEGTAHNSYPPRT